MTVQQLIERLQEMPQDDPVLFAMYTGCGDEAAEVDSVQVGVCGEESRSGVVLTGIVR